MNDTVNINRRSMVNALTGLSMLIRSGLSNEQVAENLDALAERVAAMPSS